MPLPTRSSITRIAMGRQKRPHFLSEGTEVWHLRCLLHAMPQQMNYLIDEVIATSKGSDAVISYRHPDYKCRQNMQNKLDSVENETRQLKCELLENEKLLIEAYRENGLLERELQSRRRNEESFEQREKKIQENLTSLEHFRQYNVNRRKKSRDDRIARLSEEN